MAAYGYAGGGRKQGKMTVAFNHYTKAIQDTGKNSLRFEGDKIFSIRKCNTSENFESIREFHKKNSLNISLSHPLSQWDLRTEISAAPTAEAHSNSCNRSRTKHASFTSPALPSCSAHVYSTHSSPL